MADRCSGERASDHFGDIRLRDLLGNAAHRPEDVMERQQLMRVDGRKLVRDLRGDRQQRLLVQIRIRDRQKEVGRARAERGDHDAGLP